MTSVDRKGSESYAFGGFVLDCADERLWGPAGAVRIGNKAFQVLCALINNVGRLVTKDELFATVWDGTVVSESVLTTVIKELRRALGDDMHQPRFIATVYGRGYRFIAAIEAVEEGRRPGASAAPAAAPAGGERRPPLVLVSGFDDEAVRDRQPHLAAALREEVLSGLARFREIRLIADERPELESSLSLGRASPFDYQLTAALLPDDGDIKIIARAKHLADGRIVWADSIALAGTGAAKGVETIVRRIIGSALPAVDEDIFSGLPRESDDFYEQYLIAKRRSFTARSFAEARAAADALEELIRQRPDFALAYPPLVRLYNIDFGYTALGSTGLAERDKAFELAKAGLAADRGHVHSYTVLGFCYLWRGELDLACRCFDEALALNPYNHVRFQEVATGMMFMGELAAARRMMDRALELNPIPSEYLYEDLGRLDLLEGNYEAARAMFRLIMRGSIWADLYMAVAELALGREEGKRRIQKWQERVEANWHSGASPGAAGLIDWFTFHHPLPQKVAEPLLAEMERGLVSTPEAPSIRLEVPR
jgi:DNA-binding winged helix-turn-helix (wHTH) protein/tetratricopeptide (TPR) repeat protein